MFDKKKVPWFLVKIVSFSSFFALQPQNSMPDVVVWLISGTKRIASFRIPAYDVLYSPNVESCGQYCSKVFNMFMKVTTVCCKASGLFSTRNCYLFLIILLLRQNARISGSKLTPLVNSMSFIFQYEQTFTVFFLIDFSIPVRSRWTWKTSQKFQLTFGW